MAKAKKPEIEPAPMLDLFLAADVEVAKADGGECPHLREEKTETIWPNDPAGPGIVRLTLTCLDCGRIRGRV